MRKEGNIKLNIYEYSKWTRFAKRKCKSRRKRLSRPVARQLKLIKVQQRCNIICIITLSFWIWKTSPRQTVWLALLVKWLEENAIIWMSLYVLTKNVSVYNQIKSIFCRVCFGPLLKWVGLLDLFNNAKWLQM